MAFGEAENSQKDNHFIYYTPKTRRFRGDFLIILTEFDKIKLILQ